MKLPTMLLVLIVSLSFWKAKGQLPGLGDGGFGDQRPGGFDGRRQSTNIGNPLLPRGSSRQSIRLTSQNFNDIDWTMTDRRYVLEDWNHLFPFGERECDKDVAGRPWNDQQIDLDFFLPFYGFRFNYTFIFPEGFIAFSFPRYIQPPYTFPNPKWPHSEDMSFIAPFMSEASFMSVGETSISHIWYRIIHRPWNMIGTNSPGQLSDSARPRGPYAPSYSCRPGETDRRADYGRGQRLKTVEGFVEDPDLLDRLTIEFREAMVGLRGFTADYGLIVTWERMAYGGAPRVLALQQFDEAIRWQNTYQMVLITDEIRTFVMFNYANINWTTGATGFRGGGDLRGRGGYQSAVVGFNGGNGTGFYQMPYSAEGNSYKLMQFGSSDTAGRWTARVDEGVTYGGCTNASEGTIRTHTKNVNMLGGAAINVSGPCYRRGQNVKFQVDIVTCDCEVINMAIARCFIPINSIFKIGKVSAKLSVDGGRLYPFEGFMMIMQPFLARMPAKLIDDQHNDTNHWRNWNAEELTVKWSTANLSSNPNARINVELWGYWEDLETYSLRRIGRIKENMQNTGRYTFDPRSIDRTYHDPDAWRTFRGGALQVSVDERDRRGDRGDVIYWSRLIPFGWYFREEWEYNYGANWAWDLCQEWYEYDGRLDNFIMQLGIKKIACPCTLNQALADFGRFTAVPDCDKDGDSHCYYNQGAQHCVHSTESVWNGAGQQCCYDFQGWLMFSQDYEYNSDYLRYESAGVPSRSRPWGAQPYMRPPFIPNLSNFANDLIPYDLCCKWSKSCEFYYWRRESDGCQDYRPPTIGSAYGSGHFVTYDGTRYTFPGKGTYILSMYKSRTENFMSQVRLEQPPNTLWDQAVPTTVVTGFAAKEKHSATIQVFARKTFRRWRYKLDIYIDGSRFMCDEPIKKYQHIKGIVLVSPARNFDLSIIDIIFESGVGFRVSDVDGLGQLQIMVSLPPRYNQTSQKPHDRDLGGGGGGRCEDYYRTEGLFGTFNGDKRDDMTSPDCQLTSVTQPSPRPMELRTIYEQFGEKWRVDGGKHPVLFQSDILPIYDPAAFARPDWRPIFDVHQFNNYSRYESLIFTREEVTSTCSRIYSCEYDYILTGRKEMAKQTMKAEQKILKLKRSGEQLLLSCGPLLKNPGAVKNPLGDNYLDGVTVRFQCKPDYLLHGESQRTCVNGTWTPGWWVWCRSRQLETALKLMTGLLSALICIVVVGFIFLWCWLVGRRSKMAPGRVVNQPRQQQHFQSAAMGKPELQMYSVSGQPTPPPPVPKDFASPVYSGAGNNYNVPVMESEPLQAPATARFSEMSV